MRIAFDHQIFTLQKFGGISRYFVSLAKELRRSRNEALIFSGLHQNQYLSDTTDPIVHGFRLPIYPQRGLRLRGRINSAYNKFTIPLWKPDIIHQTFQQRLKFQTDRPVIMTVYDMIYEIVPEFDPTSDRSSLEKRDSVSSVDHVICISENTKLDLMRLFGTPSEKISVVPLAADQPDQSIPPFSNGGRPYLLIVGSRVGIKNFPVFLEALAQTDILHHCDLIAFGGGPFSEAEKQKIQSLGIKSSSVMQLSGDDKILTSLYKGARLFVYPSIYEGFGLPPLEAMAAGCPVASSNTSSMPEVLGDAATYFDPRNPTEIAQVLTDVFHDSRRRKLLAREGLIRAGLYSWEKTAMMTLDVYQKVVSAK